MTDFDATQPVPEQVQNEPTSPTVMDPDAGQRLYNSAKMPQGPGTGPMRPEAPSFTPPAGSVPTEDNTGKWSNIYKPGMTPQDFHTDLGSTTSKLIQAGVDPMTALLAGGLHALDAMRDVAKEKPPQEDAGQRAGGIVDRFFAPMRGQSGAIGGAGNAAAARIAQTTADQKKKLDEFNEQHKQKMADIQEGVNLAISNAQMLHSQFLLHKEQGEEQDKNIADGKEAVKLLKSQPTAGVPVMEDVTADEIKRGIEQHTKDPKTGIDMTTMSPYATGKKEVGTDESGNPRYQATYTVMRVPPTTSITDSALAHKLFPEAKGWENVSADTPLVVPTSLYNARFQSNETSAANKAVMSKQATEAAKAQGEEAEAIEYSNFDGQTVWSRAMTDAYRNNPGLSGAAIAMKAYENLQKDNIDPATGKPKYPHLQDDVKKAYGEHNWDTMMVEDQKYHDKLEEQKEAAIEKQKAQQVEVSASRVPLTHEIQAKIDQLSPEKQAILKQYDPNTRATLMAIAFGNGEVDLEKNFPSRLTKGAPGLSTQQALGVIGQLTDNQWSEQTYKVKQDAYKDATSLKQDSLGGQASSLNRFIGHAAEVRRINNNIWNAGGTKLFKTAWNKLSTEGYGTQAVALGNAIEVVNAEYLNLINGGHVPSTPEKEAHKVLMSEDSTVGQINAAIDVMAHMASVRADGMNENYKTRTGNDFPNLINEHRVDDAKSIGMDVSPYYTGGRIGGPGNANSPIMSNTQTGAQVGAPPKNYTFSKNYPTPNGGTITLYMMPDKSIVDTQGNKYDNNGKRL